MEISRNNQIARYDIGARQENGNGTTGEVHFVGLIDEVVSMKLQSGMKFSLLKRSKPWPLARVHAEVPQVRDIFASRIIPTIWNPERCH
ncbi:MAG: hypothetical protein ACJAQT_002595 [Akkermansiaceae bacterium]|jgi:hypothetical protein